MRDLYRSSADSLGNAARAPERWDAERFAMERERDRSRSRFRDARGRFQERESHVGRGLPTQPRERSVDESYERRERGAIGWGGYEDERVREKIHYDEEEPRFARHPRGSNTFTFEKEREYYSPSPPRRSAPRPDGLVRRQSSLDTFDRIPFPRFPEEDRYGPPARIPREEFTPGPMVHIPLPRSKQLPPPRRYEREYEDIKVAEPDYYGGDDFRGYPEHIREREIFRTRRRSRSKESPGRPHHSRSIKSSVRSASSSSSSSSSRVETVRSEYPKKGKTRMPRRIVSTKAVIELGYPFEEEGEVIVIQKALGQNNIEEVIKLSEIYKKEKHYNVHGARSEAGTVVERRREEIYEVPVPPPVHLAPPPPTPPPPMEMYQQLTTTVECHPSHSHSHSRAPSPAHTHMSHHTGAPLIIHADKHSEPEIYERRDEHIERSDAIPIGALTLAPQHQGRKNERAIRAEIKVLEAEKEALRAERKAGRELRRAERIRREGRESGELILYEEKEERVRKLHGGVRTKKNKKEPSQRAMRIMLAALT